MSDDRPSLVELWRCRSRIRVGRFGLLLVLLASMAVAFSGFCLGIVLGQSLPGAWPMVPGAVGAVVTLSVALFAQANHMAGQVGAAVVGQSVLGADELVLGPFDAPLGPLVVRSATDGDADAFSSTTDIAVIEANGWTDGLRRTLQNSMHAPFFRRWGDVLTVSEAGGAVLGFATFNGYRPDGRPEAGFWLGPSARGHGWGPVVATALGEAARCAGYDWLWFGTAVENWSMRRALERAGATFDHTAPHQLPNGSVVDGCWYVLTVGPAATTGLPPFRASANGRATPLRSAPGARGGVRNWRA